MKRDFCKSDRQFVARLVADVLRGHYSRNCGFSEGFTIRLLRQLRRVRKQGLDGLVLLEKIFGKDQTSAQWYVEKAQEFADDVRKARYHFGTKIGLKEWQRLLDRELPKLLREACLKGWAQAMIKKKEAKR